MAVINEKEQRIMDAAEKLFVRYGPKKTSIDEIAHAAGLGKGTIYLYFRSKDELYAAIVRKFGQGMVEAMALASEGAADAASKLRLLIQARLSFVRDYFEEWKVTPEVVREFDENANGAIVGPIIQEFSEIQVAMLQRAIDLGIEQGIFMPADSRITAFAIYASLHTCGKPWPCEGVEIQVEAKVAAFVNLFLYGLCQRPSN